MKNYFAVVLLLAVLGLALPAKAQDERPRSEVYVGYDYVRVNSNGNSFNFNGGSGQVTYNFNRWFGVVGDLGGYYTSESFGGGIISYMFGPRISFRRHSRVTPFAQALFGGAWEIAASSQSVFAMSAGGGVDVKISRHFAVRPVQAEYFLTRFKNTPTNQQNNFRYSAGIVFRF
jgi:hypothetical protein